MVVIVESGEISALSSEACLQWAVATAPKQREAACGDGYLLLREGDRILIAVADGAGSGLLAKAASDACLDEVSKARTMSLPQLFESCHRRLVGTRGAALAVVTIDLGSAEMEWAALGDIDGVVYPADGRSDALISAIQRGGTLGHGVPDIYSQRHGLQPGQVVALSTDGVSRKHRESRPLGAAPVEFARANLEKYGREGDDRTLAVFQIGRMSA